MAKRKSYGEGSGKPGDRPLPPGVAPDPETGDLPDLDKENPSQAERIKMPYPDDPKAGEGGDPSEEPPAGP
jgi:hypothetical protein